MSIGYIGTPPAMLDAAPFHLDCEKNTGKWDIVDDKCTSCGQTGEDLRKLSPGLRGIKPS